MDRMVTVRLSQGGGLLSQLTVLDSFRVPQLHQLGCMGESARLKLREARKKPSRPPLVHCVPYYTM